MQFLSDRGVFDKGLKLHDMRTKSTNWTFFDWD
jgi:hypothetical protein